MGGLVTTEAQAEAQSEALDPWSAVAVDDLHFIRATLRANHPGPADTLNPWFREWYEDGFVEAVDLARHADDYAGYYFAIQYYLVGFQDGHLGALGESLLDNTRLPFRWPGFVVRYHRDRFEVVASDRPSVAVGWVLESCDGRSAAELGLTILQRFNGLWSVRGARSAIAPLLFVDAGNPFVEPLRACRWSTASSEREVTLEWESIPQEVLRARLRDAEPPSEASFALRRMANRAGYWISLPSFALGSDDVQEGLDRVKEAIRRERSEVLASDVLVLDVRRNGGGSSSAGDEIVAELWGRDVVAWARPHGTVVDWRVSADNTSFLRRVNLARLDQRYGSEDGRVVSYRTFVAEMDSAVARRDVLLRRGSEVPSPLTREASDPAWDPSEPQIYFLTDHACFSACLDFADLMLRIPGVEHIGLETRADAVYIDNRATRLPSGLGFFGFSMKVYRNRIRGHNESYVPLHQWDGDITDTAALEAWVVRLAGER